MRGTGGSKERGRGESKFAEKRKKRKTVFSVTPAAGPVDSDWINFTLLLRASPCHSLPQSLSVILSPLQFLKFALHMHFIQHVTMHSKHLNRPVIKHLQTLWWVFLISGAATENHSVYIDFGIPVMSLLSRFWSFLGYGVYMHSNLDIHKSG